jgi:hypothetical protein
MATPREVIALIDALAEDVYDAYDNPRLYPAPEKAKALTAARYLAPKAGQEGLAKRRRHLPPPLPLRDRHVLRPGTAPPLRGVARPARRASIE